MPNLNGDPLLPQTASSRSRTQLRCRRCFPCRRPPAASDGMSVDYGRAVPVIAETARRTANKIFRPAPGRFQPGVSGNPSGQSHFYHQCRKIARAASPEMMYGLIELAKNAKDERVRSVCLVAVLDRAGVRGEDYNPDRDPEIPRSRISADYRRKSEVNSVDCWHEPCRSGLRNRDGPECFSSDPSLGHEHA